MIRIGICGYGNLGKGVEEAIKYSKDMELVAIFFSKRHTNSGTIDKNGRYGTIQKKK